MWGTSFDSHPDFPVSFGITINMCIYMICSDWYMLNTEIFMIYSGIPWTRLPWTSFGLSTLRLSPWLLHLWHGTLIQPRQNQTLDRSAGAPIWIWWVSSVVISDEFLSRNLVGLYVWVLPICWYVLFRLFRSPWLSAIYLITVAKFCQPN